MCKLTVIILSAKSSVTFVWAVSQSRRNPRSHSSNNRTGPETTEDIVEFIIHVTVITYFTKLRHVPSGESGDVVIRHKTWWLLIEHNYHNKVY